MGLAAADRAARRRRSQSRRARSPRLQSERQAARRPLVPAGGSSPRDVLDLVDVLGVARARIAAHDWGGAVAWWVAQEHPDRIERLAVLNAPHPAVLRRTLLTSREQRRRSRYFFYFQLPFLPERKIRAGGFRPFRSILKRSSRPGTFSADDLDRYAEAAARPGALTAMSNWYRAGLWFPATARRRRVEPPVRLLWGTADTALGPEMIEPSAARCRQCEVFRFPEAGHWLQHEATAEVNERLLDFLA